MRGLVTSHSSLVPQRHYGIDPRRAPSWDVTGQHGDRSEHQGDRGERHGVCWANTIKHARNQPRERQGPYEADRQADCNVLEAPTHRQPQYVGQLGSERHADTDFVVGLAHRMGHHSVYSDGGEGERQPSEEAEQKRIEALARGRSRKKLVETLDAIYRNVFIKR